MKVKFNTEIMNTRYDLLKNVFKTLHIVSSTFVGTLPRKILSPRRHFSEKAAQVGFELAISLFRGNRNDQTTDATD